MNYMNFSGFLHLYKLPQVVTRVLCWLLDKFQR